MLYLEVTGNGPRRLCNRVVWWFKGKYLPRHHLDISVVDRGLKREGVTGWCMVNGNTSRPRSFLIEVHNKLAEDEYIKSLLHELWHVYQHIKGTLSEREAYMVEKSLYEEFVADVDKSVKII